MIANGQPTNSRLRPLAIVVLLILGLCQVSGVAIAQPEGRVVDGTAAAANSAPYIVSMQMYGVNYCAASLLNANWLVTAARCLLSSSQVFSSLLVAGSNAVAGTATTTQIRGITYFKAHHLYNGILEPNDIGLLYTVLPFTWTAAVAPVTLPLPGVVPTGTANLYGWGITSNTTTGTLPATLQVATNVPIIDLSTCVAGLGTKGSYVSLTTNLCTGTGTGGYGICMNDFGGPLVQGNVLIGIVSWGLSPCGHEPSVYTQVSSFISWISETQAAHISLI